MSDRPHDPTDHSKPQPESNPYTQHARPDAGSAAGSQANSQVGVGAAGHTTPRASAMPPQFPPPTVQQAPFVMPKPPEQKGRFKEGFGAGFGFGLGLTVMFVVLTTVMGLISMAFFAIVAGTLSNITDDATVETQTVWGPATAKHKLRAISIKGPILTSGSSGGLFTSATYGYEVADQLDGLSKDDADGVVLLVDTPGGTITGARAMSDAVKRYQKRTGHKVLVHVEGMSASGGVYATAAADQIIADHGSLVGSIGVIFGPFQRYKNVTTYGNVLSGVVTAESIDQEYISAGKDKDFGNPFRDMSAEERNVLKAGLDREYDNFVNHVAKERGIAANTIKNDLGAHIFDPETAKEKGLIDDIMGRDEFFRHAATAAGIDPNDTQVESIKAPSGLSALLGAKRPFGQALPITPVAGHPAVTNQEMCGRATPLAFAGDLKAVCGR